MEQAGNRAILDSDLGHDVARLGHALGYLARRVFAVLALLAFTYGLLAAEVELARLEHVTEPVAFTW